VLLDYFVNGGIDRSVALFGNKPLLILVGGLIAYTHIQFGKRTGRYKSVELVSAPHWKIHLSVYAVGRLLCFSAQSSWLCYTARTKM
jgi:hypothetical protein